MKENIEEVEDVETEEAVPTKSQEKKYTDEQLNKLLAKERREWKSKFDSLQSEYDSFKSEIETKFLQEEEKNKNKVETLKKDLPEQLVKLLDKLSIQEQLETLEDPEFIKGIPEKKHIPPTPEGRERDSKPQQHPLSINLR